MATPYVPVPMPIGNSASSFTTNRNQRSSSFGSVSTSSNSSKGQLEDSNMGAASSIEYSTRPRDTEEQNPETVNWEDRPSTPTILGYEVMEERAKFTLKEMFPGFRLALPPKRWFKDNYNADFLEDRQLGLQAFLQNLVAHKDIANCLAVREFLCLDDPPGPFDSLEESRAFCETLEETNYRLQKELLEKQKEMESLKKLLSEKQLHIDTLENRIRTLSLEPEESLDVSETEGEQILKVESSALEVDQDVLDEESRADNKPCLSFSEPENAVSEIEVAEVAYDAEED
ncbi:sorting nexin-16 isoform X4 [Pan troglodytes]|uniref:sorting nexin-16 isoform X4 n=1 Tax=Pan troglodytes TaxID=9598 RepID=UPI0023F0DBC3|nr:sorting nexin-16 isoform X4 [Pan troglodytes]